MTGRSHERGIALIIVLWVGLLVVAIAGAFIIDTRNSTQLARNFLDNAEARALADGGVHFAVSELVRAEEEESESAWRRDGQPHKHVVPGGALEISIEDEVGKIDLNNANEKLLEGLFLAAGVGSETTTAIVQAIDKLRKEKSRDLSPGSNNGPRGIVQREAQQLIRTSRRGSPEARSSRPTFLSVDSLGQVPGITAELHAKLKPALTVFGGSGLNYLNAPREALLAIPGISAEAVETFLAARTGADTEEPLEAFLSEGRARDHWQEGESNIVTVKVRAQSTNGAKFVRIAVIELSRTEDLPFIVKEWREGDALSITPYKPASEEADVSSRGAT